MAHGDVLVSPWVWSASDYLGRTITITIPFNNSTRAVQAGTVVRQSGCLWGHILVGVGADGSPDTALKNWAVPVGTNTITTGQFAANGVNVIEDVINFQITAKV